jgi:hypothetical protein
VADQRFIDNDSDLSGRRARLRPKPAAMSQILGDNNPLLSPLRGTYGMVWPYQPSVSYSQEVSYTDVPMTHTNQEFYAYTRTNAVKLTVEGEFTVQNQEEGRYVLACLHYLRTVTKMYFGQGANLGTPPPVLLFDAFGKYMFNKLPVIVTNFTANMPKDVDYVPVDLKKLGASTLPNLSQIGQQGNTADGFVWLPALFTISVSLTVQNTPATLRKFELDKFRSGSLLKNGGWI